jgi:hypothetical protein
MSPFLDPYIAVREKYKESLRICKSQFPSLEWSYDHRLPGFKGWSFHAIEVIETDDGTWCAQMQWGHHYLIKKEGNTILQSIQNLKYSLSLVADDIKDLSKS